MRAQVVISPDFFLPFFVAVVLVTRPGEAVSVWGSSTDESVVSLWTDYSTTYMAHKDSIDMLIIGDPSGTSSLSRFTSTSLRFSSSPPARQSSPISNLPNYGKEGGNSMEFHF